MILTSEKLLDTIARLRSKGNEVSEIELGRGANDQIVAEMKDKAGVNQKTKYANQLKEFMGMKVSVRSDFPKGRIVITYKGRIAGIIDSIAVDA